MFSFCILLVISQLLVTIKADDILPFCSDSFCSTYRNKYDCPKASLACQVQNETFQGEVFSAAVPCGCCQTCVEFSRKGDYCTIGSPDSAPPQKICGPGLTCMKVENEDDVHVCEDMESSCFIDQRTFDESKNKSRNGLYMSRPHCDGDGDYGPVKCNINQTCFCVDDNGKRIFGEMPYKLNIELTMQCECSRLTETFKNYMGPEHEVPTVRCLEDGSFDPLHCVNDMCYCVEPASGAPQTYKYNTTETNFKAMKCFNETIHRDYTYLHDCEAYQYPLLEEVYKASQAGFYIMKYKVIKCQPDGWYIPVQEDDTTKYCVDKYGEVLSNYVVPKTSLLATNMDCKCARTTEILKNAKISELPTCSENGNFEKIQCRKEKCYCVDDNGLQVTKEVDAVNKKNIKCP